MTTLRIERDVHFQRGNRSRKIATTLPSPTTPPGRVPRITKLLALAIRFDKLLRDGVVTSYAEIAALGHVTSARVSQIMSLLQLAPDIQEEILFLPRVQHGRDPIHLHDLQPIAAEHDWRKQRRRWRGLLRQQVG